MTSTEKRLQYEEERHRIIEENKRRMEELGLSAAIASLNVKKSQSVRKTPRVSLNLRELSVETRRSSRAASRPKVDYKEGGMDMTFRRPRAVGRHRPLRRGTVSTVAKNEAATKAGHIVTSHPSFVKAMLKSHTSGGFWLGLPSDFCSKNFTKDDLIMLEDEDGMEWECVYLHHKHGLSGGWRGFSIDHELDDGDAVVFELVTSTRFKVFITRASDLGPEGEPPAARKKNYQYVVKDSENAHVYSSLHKTLKREELQYARQNSERARPLRKSNRKVVLSSEESEESLDEPTSEDETESESASSEEEEEEEEESDHESQPPVKVLDITKRLVKSKKGCTEKSVPKARQGSSHRRGETLKVTTKMVKKETFVRRTSRKTDMQGVKKEIAARQTEQKRSLQPGIRLKPMGVCSIAKGSVKRKLPAMFPARKYSFFSGPKSVKVH